MELFPAECCVLVLEGEPVGALDLSCMLAHFGCRVLGPADSPLEAAALIKRQRPSFALLDAGSRTHALEALAESLAKIEVPFALLATGKEGSALDTMPALRRVPRIVRPFGPNVVYRVARALHRDDLRAKITATDRRIGEGRARLARQIRLVERLEALGVKHGTATALAREFALALRVMRASRTIFAQQLEAYRD